MSPSPTLRIGKMRRVDAPAVAKMMRGLAAFHGEKTPTTAKQFVAFACGTKKITNILVAYAYGKPVGFIEFHYLANFRRGMKTARCDFFFVEEKVRGTGYGFALFQAAVAAALTAGCKRFDIGADPKNDISNAYYARMELEQTSTDHFDYRADEAQMRRITRQNIGQIN